jgi:YbgC/YbaW family acyl-CoA thioester hydrolase
MDSDPSAAAANIVPFVSRHEVTVEWGDCDPAGIVYYPTYFRWIDQATHRLFHNAGAMREGTTGGRWTEGIPLVAAECSFRRASQPGEKLTVESHISRFGRSSFTISHVFRDASGEIAAEGTETRIWARKAGDASSLKSVPIPADVRRRLGG